MTVCGTSMASWSALACFLVIVCCVPLANFCVNVVFSVRANLEALFEPNSMSTTPPEPLLASLIA